MTLSTVGYGDILPVNTIEVTISIILMCTGVTIYWQIVSQLINVFSNEDQFELEPLLAQSSKVQQVTNLAKKYKFSEKLTRKI